VSLAVEGRMMRLPEIELFELTSFAEMVIGTGACNALRAMPKNSPAVASSFQVMHA